jgi:hypothetical protein
LGGRSSLSGVQGEGRGPHSICILPILSSFPARGEVGVRVGCAVE